jgi:hypothetical protein
MRDDAQLEGNLAPAQVFAIDVNRKGVSDEIETVAPRYI